MSKKLTNTTDLEELAVVAERFGMTKGQAVRTIIHEIYESGVNHLGLTTALTLLCNLDDESVCGVCSDEDCGDCENKGKCTYGILSKNDFEEKK